MFQGAEPFSLVDLDIHHLTEVRMATQRPAGAGIVTPDACVCEFVRRGAAEALPTRCAASLEFVNYLGAWVGRQVSCGIGTVWKLALFGNRVVPSRLRQY